ncbi:antirestriction protein [Candidatus Parcubacteria bacterium]|nr:MAG: antirestriction protein [Candidatus Parcubacteria bacterium]
MNDKIKQALDSILERFKAGDIPQAVACSMFPIPDVPSARWSILNRLLIFLAGTSDARGYRQWQEVNRYVKKGARSISILVPCMKKLEEEETGKEKEILIGFVSRPVFRYEDTDGEPIEHKDPGLPKLPLLNRAREWGITVKAVPGNYRYYGYYSSGRREIGLATAEEKTFFHELSHAAHEKIKGSLIKGQDHFQEIVAELSAQALCIMVGKNSRDTSGNSYRYIESYAEKAGLSPLAACLKVLSQTEKVLSLILYKEDEPGIRLAA